MGTLKATRLRSTAQRSVMLVIGQKSEWADPGIAAEVADYHYVDFSDLDRVLMARIQPDTVVSSLFGRGFDAIDIAKKLHQLEFTGRYRALTGNLPNPDMIRREVAQVAPGLDFDVLNFLAPKITLH